MAPCSTLFLALALSFQLLLPPTFARSIQRRYDNNEIQVDKTKHDEQFFDFATRPDIDAPRWDIKLHNPSALAEGYWFTAPYGIVGQTDHKKAYVGPHIYDSDGELIWSGAPLFQGYDAFDFKVSTVDGKDMLTAIWPHKGVVAIIDNTYNIYKMIHIGDEKDNTLNLHDFQMIENGTKAIFPTKIPKKASRELSQAVDYDGKCNVEFDGFQERDIHTGKLLFEWSSEGRIALDESTIGGRPEEKCGGRKPGDAWDYFHINSIDKLPDGDYLISGRRTYALYKISAKDGSIVWRLGGKRSNFEWRGDLEDGHFSGQHDARFLSQNETHMLVSMMDNASGPGAPFKTNDNSRGLVLALQIHERPLTAQVVAKYAHPYGEYAPARGNFQTLPGGNRFVGWTTDSLHSEHTDEGASVMDAKLKSGLKSYRSYKMPWIGRPSAPPDVVSKAIIPGAGSDSDGDSKTNMTTTLVRVSWNGATEVSRWQLYKTGPDGLNGTFEAVALTKRQGFETSLVYPGFAKFVVVQALDADGQALGSSRVMETEIARAAASRVEVLEEMQWLQDNVEGGNAQTSWREMAESTAENPVATFVGGVLFCVAAGLTGWGVRRCVGGKRKGRAVDYEQIRRQEKETDEFELDDDADDEASIRGKKSGSYED